MGRVHRTWNLPLVQGERASDRLADDNDTVVLDETLPSIIQSFIVEFRQNDVIGAVPNVQTKKQAPWRWPCQLYRDLAEQM